LFRSSNPPGTEDAGDYADSGEKRHQGAELDLKDLTGGLYHEDFVQHL